MTVNTNVSDLFFNRELSDCKKFNGVFFNGYDKSKLIEEAKSMISSLEGLGLSNLPNPKTLVEDFMDRI